MLALGVGVLHLRGVLRTHVRKRLLNGDNLRRLGRIHHLGARLGGLPPAHTLVLLLHVRRVAHPRDLGRLCVGRIGAIDGTKDPQRTEELLVCWLNVCRVGHGVEGRIVAVPHAVVLVQVDGHAHLRVEEHGERSTASELGKVARLAETRNVGGDIEELGREGWLGNGVLKADADEEIEFSEESAGAILMEGWTYDDFFDMVGDWITQWTL